MGDHDRLCRETLQLTKRNAHYNHVQSTQQNALAHFASVCTICFFFCAGARPSAITVHAAHASAVHAEALPESTPPFPLRAARSL